MSENPSVKSRKARKPLSASVRHMVWREGGDMPTVVHPTWEGAYASACKLADANPGVRFHVLQTRAMVNRQPVAARQAPTHD